MIPIYAGARELGAMLKEKSIDLSMQHILDLLARLVFLRSIAQTLKSTYCTET